MKSNYSIRILVTLVFVLLVSCNTEQDNFSEITKIALRDAGNKLLLSQKDSTSLILPVKELHANKYQLTFNNFLAIEPNTLVEAIDESFDASNLPEHYIVEVIQCNDDEVAYSYQMSAAEGNTIIPCLNRYLNKGCYQIEVNFIKRTVSQSNIKYYALLLFILAVQLGIIMLWHKKSKREKLKDIPVNYEVIGSFKFYPDQNKLIKEAEEIALSKKECELLALLAERPNKVIKRDELTKRIWEDNGVFVGRSLDTYISKLRKKLQTDTSVKLTNVHGVGYKLEIL